MDRQLGRLNCVVPMLTFNAFFILVFIGEYLCSTQFRLYYEGSDHIGQIQGGQSLPSLHFILRFGADCCAFQCDCESSLCSELRQAVRSAKVPAYV